MPALEPHIEQTLPGFNWRQKMNGQEIVDAPMTGTIHPPKQSYDCYDRDIRPIKIFRFSQKSQLLFRYVSARATS